MAEVIERKMRPSIGIVWLELYRRIPGQARPVCRDPRGTSLEILGIAYLCLTPAFLNREFTQTVLSRSGPSGKQR